MRAYAKPRLLTANEINVRVCELREGNDGGQGKVYARLLLYKDVRAVMEILDETFGPLGWQREHRSAGRECGIGVLDPQTGQWVWRWDEGASSPEGGKTRASDSFSRAAVNWGIGRELYTAPQIVLELSEREYFRDRDRLRLRPAARFTAGEIGYSERRIVRLSILDGKGNLRFGYGL